MEETNQDSGSLYHYSYSQNQFGDEKRRQTSGAGRSGKNPRDDRYFRKILTRAAAVALMVGVVGVGALHASKFLGGDSSSNIVAQAAEETKSTEIGRGVDSKAEMITLSSTDTNEKEYSVKDVVAYAMPSMVAITSEGVEEVQDYFFGRTYQQEVKSSGSGVIIGENDEELLIATNNHVVEGAENLTVCFTVDAEDADDLVVSAKVKGKDPNHDLAIISIKLSEISDDVKSKIKVMEIGNSDELALGEQVVAIGNALGYGQSVTSGYVSALDREVTVDTGNGGYVTNNMIQTDASINPGNSGGALLNMKGQLIGINSVKASASGVEGMGYAIPIDTAMPIFEELKEIQSREIVDEDKRGYLGMKPADVTTEARQIYNMPAGAFVYEVIEDSAAEKAGLKRGDIITKMGGVIISSASDLYARMEYYAEGDELVLTIERTEGGEYKEQTITVVLDKKPESAQVTSNSNSRSNQKNRGEYGWDSGEEAESEESTDMVDPFSRIFPEYFTR